MKTIGATKETLEKNTKKTSEKMGKALKSSKENRTAEKIAKN